ncbi:hypothetical protein V495_03864 [Pseudogymnoascus sp. VKM F-4514 (FW-929)]|nr:hypothetical protein V495_03864 [Pseudogymnoascus sp. VKM F-4514 (FW-929)]KFY60527.1 hypothetical protein V497_03591 [Pseudogymnoascus sp. VKM F-4516 (FW-969)]
MDGTEEKRQRLNRQSHAPVAAIFVHAGAGYHSTTNEQIHLSACADACMVAMRFLRGGGTAVDAVEAAIKVLEDKEITNAGYGSNLTIEGIVECDATIVDHLGRSGACGAVAKIRNPIHLARIILEESSRPLSLRRVPPNLLIADGAAEFGFEHGMDIVHHDALVSKNARERFIRWREDLRKAEFPRTPHSPGSPGSPGSPDSPGDEVVDHEYEERVRDKQRRDHFNALMSATWNEGQPGSPQAPSPTTYADDMMQDIVQPDLDPLPTRAPASTNPKTPRTPDAKVQLESNAQSRTAVSPLMHSAKRPRYSASRSSEGHGQRGPSSLKSSTAAEPGDEPSKGVSDTSFNLTHPATGKQRKGTDGSDDTQELHTLPEPEDETPKPFPAFMLSDIDEDRITDTVGAIAIDIFGNIAAGSSSGGIGMKHRGRVGPAALVGVGTAVIPADFEDSENITVAAVTSGTGEHMATTMASQKCAERLYFCTKRGRGGTNTDANEEEAMESFVLSDFMEHPGVKNSHSAGAIGVMAVKKMPEGYFLHFAHNTDSFALASMHSGEREPKCVMSRIGDSGVVVQGGRKIRVE